MIQIDRKSVGNVSNPSGPSGRENSDHSTPTEDPCRIYLSEKCDGVDMFSLKLPCLTTNINLASKQNEDITIDLVAFYILDYLLHIKNAMGVYTIEKDKIIASVGNLFNIYFNTYLESFGRVNNYNNNNNSNNNDNNGNIESVSGSGSSGSQEKLFDDAVNVAESYWEFNGFFVTLYCLKLLIVYEKRTNQGQGLGPGPGSPSMTVNMELDAEIERIVMDNTMNTNRKGTSASASTSASTRNKSQSNDEYINSMFHIGLELLSNPPHTVPVGDINSDMYCFEKFEDSHQLLIEFLQV